MSGVRIDDTTNDKVTMVAVSKQQQNETRDTRTNNYNNQRYNRPQRQERLERRETDGPQTTECTFCSLIRDKDVPQEWLRMDFKDRHRELSSRPIFANDCLAWLLLSLDEREKVLKDNELKCRWCLRTIKPGSRGNVCEKGHHIFNNGRNGMCIEKNCEMHSTVCKAHANANRNKHHILKRCIE